MKREPHETAPSSTEVAVGAAESAGVRVMDGSIRAALLRNARLEHPLPPSQLAQLLGCSPDSVNEAQSRLRRAGVVPASQRQFSRVATAPRRDAENGVLVFDPRAFLADIEQEVPLTELDRRRILSRLARRAPSPVQVQACKTLEEMDRQTGKQVGPPLPLTDEEMVERTGKILYGAGSDLGGQAIGWALERWKADELRPTLPGDSSEGSSARATAGVGLARFRRQLNYAA